MNVISIEAPARRRLSSGAEGAGKSDGKRAQDPTPSDFLTCINAREMGGCLTEGRDYQVVSRDGRYVRIVDDRGEETRFYVARFRHPLSAPPILDTGKKPWRVRRVGGS